MRALSKKASMQFISCQMHLGRFKREFLFSRRGSLIAEMAIIAGACVIVIIIMANVCLYLIRVAQFDRISGEVARSCAYADAPWSAQEGIVQAMGLTKDGGRFQVSGSESRGGVCGTNTVQFELEYQPFVSEIGIGNLAIKTPVFKRVKTYAVPSIGYEAGDTQ